MKKSFNFTVLLAIGLFFLIFSNWVNAETTEVLSEARVVAKYNFRVLGS